jgi:hypothetical protein
MSLKIDNKRIDQNEKIKMIVLENKQDLDRLAGV